MRKFFVILSFLAFTINVKADYAPIEVQLSEGEQYLIDEIIAAQVINQTSWDGQYILTGGVARVYTDFLPQDGYLDGRTRKYYVCTVEYDTQNQQYYIRYNSNLNGQPVAEFNSPWDAYQWYISSSNTYCNGFFSFHDDEDGNGEYITLSGFYPDLFVGRVDPDTNQPLDYGGQEALRTQATAYNQVRFLQQSDILEYAQVPINGVSITVTNSSGQVTSQHDYTSYLVSIQSLLGQVNSNLTDLKNILGFSGEGLDNLESFLAHWRTTDGINQGQILNAITNLTDYTPYFALLDSYQGTNGIIDAYNLIEDFRRSALSAPLSSIVGKGQNRRLLYGDWYDLVNSKVQPITSAVGWQGTESFLSDLDKWQFIRYHFDTAMQLRQASFETNIINGVSLGRDWLNLATNDLNSFTYWLNQQTLVQNGTNGASSAQQKYDAITNQYAQISLVGANASNTAQNWDYFKRLEMLLAALVYKQTDYEGTIDNHESGNNASVSSSVSSGEDQINTSLTAVKDALTLSTIGGAKNSIVSLFQTATSAFDVTGSKRVINVMETDFAGGNEGAGITVNLDFTQGELGDFADFVHHLFGFLWGFGSLFIFWRVCKFCWDMGYKVVKFHYSLCRKFLGI